MKDQMLTPIMGIVEEKVQGNSLINLSNEFKPNDYWDLDIESVINSPSRMENEEEWQQFNKSSE